jgi:hypothetical protein
VWTLWERENLLLPSGIEPEFLRRPVHNFVTMPTELSGVLSLCSLLNAAVADNGGKVVNDELGGGGDKEETVT